MRLTPLAALIAATTVFASAGSAQTAAPPKTNVISIQPLSAVFGVYAAEYEHAVSPTVTFGVGGSYWSNDDNESKTKYASGDIKLRYYPEAQPFRGFSFGGQLGYTSISDQENVGLFGGSGSKSTANGPTIGVALDYNWLLGASRSFYVGLGVGAKKIFANAHDLGSANLAYPTARISIGYAY